MTTEFTRQELYDAIWSKPAVQLAKETGVSDVAIAKTCKKYDIPKPPLGYWAKVQHGHQAKRPPLPKVDDPARQNIHFQPVSEHSRRDSPSAAVKERAQTEKAEENRIAVPDVLGTPHPLVERTLRSLTSAAPDKEGIVIPKAKDCLQVAVGKGSIDRAMRIMNALIVAATDRGMKVTAESGRKWSTLIHADGEVLAMRMGESLGERKTDLTAAQRRENERHTYFKTYPETEKYPRGVLTLTARGEKDEYVQKRWSESDGKPLDERLNAVVAWLYKAVEEIKTRRQKFAEQAKRWEEERRASAEAERLRFENAQKLKQLEDAASAWRRAHGIRSYVDAVEQAATLRDGDAGKTKEVAVWAAWARRRADEIDPITHEQADDHHGGDDE